MVAQLFLCSGTGQEKVGKKKTGWKRAPFWKKSSKKPAHYYSKSLQRYLCENKTVKGGLLWELPLSVYSDWKAIWPTPVDIIYFSPVMAMQQDFSTNRGHDSCIKPFKDEKIIHGFTTRPAKWLNLRKQDPDAILGRRWHPNREVIAQRGPVLF